MSGAAIGLLLGLLGGGAQFALLRWNTDLYLRGGAFGRAIGLQVLRLGLLGVVLTALAWHGAVPLLAGALGVQLARGLVLYRARRAAP